MECPASLLHRPLPLPPCQSCCEHLLSKISVAKATLSLEKHIPTWPAWQLYWPALGFYFWVVRDQEDNFLVKKLCRFGKTLPL